MTINDLQVGEGEAIRPVLARLVRYLRRDAAVKITGPARVIRRVDGREVVYDPPAVSFPGSFRVRLVSSTEIEIGEGLVGGQVPVIDDRRIDGLDENGETDSRGIPRLTIEPPEAGLRSWIALAATTTTEGNLDTEAAAPVAVVHIAEIPANLRDPEGRTLRLVAALAWKGTRVETVRQIVWFDQEVYAVDGIVRYRAAA